MNGDPVVDFPGQNPFDREEEDPLLPGEKFAFEEELEIVPGVVVPRKIIPHAKDEPLRDEVQILLNPKNGQ